MARYRSTPSPAARAALPVAGEWGQGVRDALFRTLPGRAIVVGLLIRVVLWPARFLPNGAPAFFSVVDTVAGLAIAGGAVYFLFRLLVLAKHRLLWRVRRKLILSYVFMGFVPAGLIGGFFVLCGLLLFYNFSSYWCDRLRSLADQARFWRARPWRFSAVRPRHRRHPRAPTASMASSATVSRLPSCPWIGRARSSGVKPQGSPPPPGSSRVEPSPSKVVTAGPWARRPAVDHPAVGRLRRLQWTLAYTHPTDAASSSTATRTRPSGSWADAQLDKADEDTHMFVRAAAFPESPTSGYAVVVDLLMSDQLEQRLRRQTGVELKSVADVPITDRPKAKPLRGRQGGDTAAPSGAVSVH